MYNFIHSLTEPLIIIQTLGLVGIFAIVFAESGLFFGFFFPGDSLLFTAGFLASQGLLSPSWLFIGVFIAAVAGDSVGYAFGKKVGTKIFTRDESIFFNKKYPIEAKKFYEQYGTRAIVYARFVPVIRTFAPIVAGVGEMKYATFLKYNILGGFLWSVALTGAGYILGNSFPSAAHYITPIIIVIIVISVLPAAREVFRSFKDKQKM